MQQPPTLHFLHLGKTGGTAIKHALSTSPSPHFTVHLHPHAVKLRDIAPGEGIFFFLRDPLSRFVSGFYSRQRRGQPRYLSPWSEAERVAFAHFHSPNQLATALASANVEERATAQHAVQSIEHVRNSYWQWFGDEDYLQSRAADIWFIGLQEHLASDFEVLKLKLGLPKSVQLPQDDVQAHRNPASLDRTLSEEAADNLTRWYKADYAFLALCRALAQRQGLGGSIVTATPLAITTAW